MNTLFRPLQNTGMSLNAGLCALVLLALSACGGGGSGGMGMYGATTTPTMGTASPQSCGADCGGAMVTITDAQGDFTNYTVTVNSIQLKKANGAVVETLSKASMVDFSQLVDLSEVFSAGQIPAGDYVGASIALDFTNSTLIVDDGSAAGLKVSPVDKDGKPITTLTLDVQLDNKNHLVITPGKIARLALDFNLLASNTVNTTNATVTVQPVLVASVTPSDTKQIRVRGGLSSVDAANSDYVVNVLPFHESSNMTGQVTVHTTAQTTYEINGTTYVGAAGLTALAALPAGTMTAAFGAVQISDMTFTAANVLAGTSLENKNVDLLIGDVVARSGNTLTVRGIEIDRRDDDGFEFGHGNISVTVGAQTMVTAEGQSGNLDIAAISVGQRITVFGMESAAPSGTGSGSSGSDSSSSGPGGPSISFDATAGRIRMGITPIWGMVTNTVAPTSSGSGSVTVNLRTIDDRAVSAYNFAGTGKTTAENANPASYIVNTQSLPLAGLAMNSPTRLFGFVTPFGSAHPDFKAVTLVDFSAAKAELEINWGLRGATAPFTTESSTQLVLDLSNPNIGLEHEIEIGPLHVDLKSLSSSPMIVPATSMQLYSIAHVGSHRIENFNSFADFTAALTTTLNGTAAALTLTAQGSYNSATNTFSAEHMTIVVNN